MISPYTSAEIDKVKSGGKAQYEIFRSSSHDIVAMLDLHPFHRGHTVIVPKRDTDIWAPESVRVNQALATTGLFIAQLLKIRFAPVKVMSLASYDENYPALEVIPYDCDSDLPHIFDQPQPQLEPDHETLAATHLRLTLTQALIERIECNLDFID